MRYTDPARLVEVFPRHFGPGRGSDPAAFVGNPIALANLVYGDREGNCTPTDGWTFRGRGWPQLTFRDAYRAYSPDAGLDLERGPDAMLRLDISARVTIAFMRRKLGLLDAADAADMQAVRHLWNGGANGLEDAQAAFDKLTVLWEAQ
jgi:putative chitinase